MSIADSNYCMVRAMALLSKVQWQLVQQFLLEYLEKNGDKMFEVLVVEDEDLIRKGLVYTFNWLAYDCVVIGEACNGKEALDMIHKYKPDIVITDIKMPLLMA